MVGIKFRHQDSGGLRGYMERRNKKLHVPNLFESGPLYQITYIPCSNNNIKETSIVLWTGEIVDHAYKLEVLNQDYLLYLTGSEIIDCIRIS